jgi:hypothetical protein
MYVRVACFYVFLSTAYLTVAARVSRADFADTQPSFVTPYSLTTASAARNPSTTNILTPHARRAPYYAELPRWGPEKRPLPPTPGIDNAGSSRTVVHEDSGVRLAWAGDNATHETLLEPPQELPPVYRDYNASRNRSMRRG